MSQLVLMVEHLLDTYDLDEAESFDVWTGGVRLRAWDQDLSAS